MNFAAAKWPDRQLTAYHSVFWTTTQIDVATPTARKPTTPSGCCRRRRLRSDNTSHDLSSVSSASGGGGDGKAAARRSAGHSGALDCRSQRCVGTRRRPPPCDPPSTSSYQRWRLLRLGSGRDSDRDHDRDRPQCWQRRRQSIPHHRISPTAESLPRGACASICCVFSLLVVHVPFPRKRSKQHERERSSPLLEPQNSGRILGFAQASPYCTLHGVI